MISLTQHNTAILFKTQRSQRFFLRETMMLLRQVILIIVTVLLPLHIPSSQAQTCRNYNFASNQIFPACNDLPVLNSYLYYNYDPASRTARIAYRHAGVSPSNWVAWAINPTGQGMIGAQALVAYRRSDGSVRAYTSPVTDFQTQLRQGDLSFPVTELTATYSGNEMVIFATLGLGNLTSPLNQVWQEGPVSNDVPGIHLTSGPNLQSTGSLNLLSGESSANGGGGVSSRTRKRNIHGVLNAVSWGAFLPIGAIFARYLKVFPSADPAWFYLHATCQTSAYIIGVAGWGTGLKLGSESKGVQYTTHRVIGIIIFSLGTLQLSALLLRPKNDHKYRIFWNMYHHLIGYSVIALSIANIFKGFDILNPEDKWKRAYVGVLIGLAVVALILEIYTWLVVIKRKRSSSRNDHRHNGENGKHSGFNGYGDGTQDRL